jgi:integration host factor subunit beta
MAFERAFWTSPEKLPYSSEQMNRSDLIQLLADRFSQLTQKDAEAAVSAILDTMNNALMRGYRIEIRGFGSFTVIHRAPRLGRNPRSGAAVDIPERRAPHFKVGKALR